MPTSPLANDPGESISHKADDSPPAHPPAPRCPFCGSADVEPMALFGSQLMTQQYYCRACRTPFERVKDEE